MAMMPVDLFRLEAADLVGRGHGGMGIPVDRLPYLLGERTGRKGCRLAARRKNRGADGDAECYHQEISTFHAGFLYCEESAGGECRGCDVNAR
ncbi:hypothetical protein JQ615_18905 [Bradyrhizobium jicamae]|uniref:Uncharacterized protein n=1 Tax=Bradyrhizobium jicamae TaxID=280332 RepID=A0ABS5FKZ5_9BRAD|nr:hypothetical protein [Bradyrhizobium jicamae]MBR0797462.1 hypothetical protein [Bradyrhizobium jicamae]MBR0939131.1 hypothetical protein [Bradyrhizobium jicamae]